MSKKVLPRRKARELVVQAIYSWEVAQPSEDDLLKQFHRKHADDDYDVAYFDTVVKGVVEDHIEIDRYIEKAIDRNFDELTPVELAILRYATYELAHCVDIPKKVVINEAIELTKLFGAEHGHKYVNAVLDKLMPTLRAHEV